MYYVIDRIEGGIAIVVADDGATLQVPKKHLPAGSSEGVVLRVDGDEAPDWSGAIVDEAERLRRLERVRETQRRMASTDPGGDIVL